MNKKNQWKTVLEYTAGILLLAVVIGLALSLPEFYASWQDTRLFSQVTTSSREDIQFLDTASLDAEERIKMLGQVETVYDYNSTEMDPDPKTLETFTEKLDQWVDCGLIPEFTRAVFSENSVYNFGYDSFNTDQGVLPVYIVIFAREETEEGDVLQGLEVTQSYGQSIVAIMDAVTDTLYATYVFDDTGELENYYARCLGYSSMDDALVQMINDNYFGRVQPREEDYTKYNFASVSGASSATVLGEPGMLNFDVELQYDSFTGKAYRRLRDTDFSLMVSLGSLCWDYDSEMLSPSGFISTSQLFDSAANMDVYPVSWDEEALRYYYECEDTFLAYQRMFQPDYNLYLPETETEAIAGIQEVQ